MPVAMRQAGGGSRAAAGDASVLNGASPPEITYIPITVAISIPWLSYSQDGTSYRRVRSDSRGRTIATAVNVFVGAVFAVEKSENRTKEILIDACPIWG